jgi:peptidoglycan hydrolase-like protein with peptidoglycan-binding domain
MVTIQKTKGQTIMFVNENVSDGQHLNARTGAGTNNPIKYYIPRGDEVTVIQSNTNSPVSGWSEIEPTHYPSRGTAWVMDSYLSSTHPGAKYDTLAFALGDKTLSYGYFGRYVHNLQVGLGITADGDFGPATFAAVKDFQTDNGLSVDGLAGANTKAALWADTTIQANIINNGI